MNEWNTMRLGEAITFNPSEKISKGSVAKKIAMEKLMPFQRNITGYEEAVYLAGPKFRNGDTLLAKITPCLENGKTAQVSILDKDEVAFGSSEFIVLRENEYTINDFIYYFAKSPAFRRKAISCMEGTSGRKRVNEGALKLQELPVPNISIQGKIANVLSALDTKIELNNRINVELELMAKTLYDYWFVQFDFPFDFKQGKPCTHSDTNSKDKKCSCKPYKFSGGKMIFNEELKREIPEYWKCGSLGQYCKVIRGVTYSKENVITKDDKNVMSILRATNIRDSEIDLNDMVYIPSNLVSNDQYLEMFDTLIVMSSGSKEHIGKNALYYFTTKTAFGAFCSKISIRGKHKFYVNIFMHSQNFKKYIRNNCLGTNINNLTNDHINECNILMPDEESIIQFDNIVSPIFNKIGANIRENDLLSSFRDWLLPLLLNGQVKVA